MKTLSGTLALLPLLLPLAACGDESAAEKPASKPAAKPLVVTTDDVRFEVPADWRTIDADLGQSALSAAAEDLGSTPELLEQQLGALDVLAAAPKPDKGFLDNINVARSPLPLPTADQLRNQFATLGVTDSDVREKETPLGTGLASSYLLETQRLTVYGMALTLPTDDHVVTITISTDRPEQSKALAVQLIDSLGAAS